MDRSCILDIQHPYLSALDFTSGEAVPVVGDSVFCIGAIVVLFAFDVAVVDSCTMASF